MQNGLLLGFLHVGPGQVVEVSPLPQNIGALIVEVQKVLEVPEVISRAKGLDRGIWKLDAVTPSKREHHLGLERALDVQMQLGFRQPLDKLGECTHCAAAVVDRDRRPASSYGHGQESSDNVRLIGETKLDLSGR